MFIDINIGPKDPRFIGAWWLGFVILGFASMLIALPVMCFPRTLKPRHAKKEYGHIPGLKSSSFSKELKGKSCIYVQLNGPVKLAMKSRHARKSLYSKRTVIAGFLQPTSAKNLLFWFTLRGSVKNN